MKRRILLKAPQFYSGRRKALVACVEAWLRGASHQIGAREVVAAPHY